MSEYASGSNNPTPRRKRSEYEPSLLDLFDQEVDEYVRHEQVVTQELPGVSVNLEDRKRDVEAIFAEQSQRAKIEGLNKSRFYSSDFDSRYGKEAYTVLDHMEGKQLSYARSADAARKNLEKREELLTAGFDAYAVEAAINGFRKHVKMFEPGSANAADRKREQTRVSRVVKANEKRSKSVSSQR